MRCCTGLLLLAALALSSARVQDIIVRRSAPIRRASLLNPVLEGRVPELPQSPTLPEALTPPALNTDQILPDDFVFGDNVNLEWKEFGGSIPNGAVSIYNGYTERTDYVCQYQCQAGFYNPALGPYCRYPYGDREYYAPEFRILTNKDNFEFLEWKDESYGGVPKHSVRTCGDAGIYVGKNKYGLGKVVPQFKAFFLPWEGDEYWYKKYQVLTINRDAYTQHISDVKYAIDEAELFQYPPETMQISGVTNNECQSVSKTVTLSKTSELETTWNIGRGTMLGITGSITAKIPFIGEGGVELGGEKTLQFDRVLGLLLLATLALSSARVQDIIGMMIRRASLLNPVLEGRVPELPQSPTLPEALTPPALNTDQILPDDFLFGDNVNLEWKEFDGSIPNGAVSIYNGYTERTDYVCEYQGQAGFYNPALGPYCRYPYGGREYYAPEFRILTNKDNFEFLEWKDESYGGVPKHSVRTCGKAGTYVGKNKYGLGKVVPQFKAFFLPWEGDEYWYKKYQISGVTNNECQSVSKTVTLSKTSELETTWNIGRGTMLGITGSITANIPFIGEGGDELGGEKTLQFDRGTTRVESISHSVSVELKVPPNTSCRVRMEGHRFKADVPYSLSRTYRNGETQWTFISGTYDGVSIGEVRAVVERCEPVPDAKPCP